MIQFRVLGHVPPSNVWLKIPSKVISCSKAGNWTPSIPCSKTTPYNSRQLQTYHRIRPRHLLHSAVELDAKQHVINVDNGAALCNSKLKPRLTRCPTRRSAPESVAPASHEPGRHVRGELHKQPPSTVWGGGVEHERPASRAATFAQLHTPAATFPVASLWMFTTASHLCYPRQRAGRPPSFLPC